MSQLHNRNYFINPIPRLKRARYNDCARHGRRFNLIIARQTLAIVRCRVLSGYPGLCRRSLHVARRTERLLQSRVVPAICTRDTAVESLLCFFAVGIIGNGLPQARTSPASRINILSDRRRFHATFPGTNANERRDKPPFPSSPRDDKSVTEYTHISVRIPPYRGAQIYAIATGEERGDQSYLNADLKLRARCAEFVATFSQAIPRCI